MYIPLLQHETMQPDDLRNAIDYLVNEKMLESHPVYSAGGNLTDFKYYITFKGRIRVEIEKGYVGILNQKHAAEKKAEENRKQLHMLTALASIGTAGALVIQTLDLLKATPANSVFVLSPLWLASTFFVIRYFLQRLDSRAS
jgi:hypothetical protein